MRVRFRWLCVILPALILPGCGVPDWWLGAEHGALFQGLDTVVRPGEPATLRVSLRAGVALRAMSDYTVFLYTEDGRTVGVKKTDKDGLAAFTVILDEPGLYRYRASLDPAELGTFDLPTTLVQAGVYDSKTRFLIIDLDGTLVAQEFEVALLADPQPMANARESLGELAGKYQPLYLTNRPEYLSRRSRQWLEDHHMPSGPLIVRHLARQPDGESFKSGFIRQLVERFGGKHAGVGDQPSDIRAYAANGLLGLLIDLPADTQVVTDWPQIAQVLLGQASYPVAQMRRRLERPASQSAPVRLRDAAQPDGAAQPQGAAQPDDAQPRAGAAEGQQ
jgi:hypothetical protein